MPTSSTKTKTLKKSNNIKRNSKGEYIKANRKVITGNDSTVWRKQAENYINKQIRKGKDVKVIAPDGEALTITKDTAGKAKFRNFYLDKNGNKHYMTDQEFKVKLIAEVHIDELAQISKKINKKVIADTKNHPFAKNGFNYRNAYFENFDGNYYYIIMSVGKNGNINTIYNIGQLRKRRNPRFGLFH